MDSNTSFGLYKDKWYKYNVTSFGKENSDNYLKDEITKDIRINEVSESGIELYNLTDNDINLNGYSIGDKSGFNYVLGNVTIKKNDYISEINGGLCAVNNVEASGARSGKYGVSIIVSKGSNASGVFTSNKVTAASVKYTKKVLENEIVSAVVANSGNANCFTGKQGLKDCESLVDFVSEKLGIDKKYFQNT